MENMDKSTGAIENAGSGFQEQVNRLCSDKYMGTLGMNKNPKQSKNNPMSGSSMYSKNMSEYGKNRLS